MCVFSTDLGENEDFASGSALVSRFAAWLAAWPSTKLKDLFLFISWKDQRAEMAGFDSTSWVQFYFCVAWDQNLFSFYLYMLILFLNALQKKVSDITIILTSNNSYDYLLKLLQISLCLCVSLTAGRLEDCVVH